MPSCVGSSRATVSVYDAAPMPPLDGYLRVSQVGGRSGERFQSPDAQRDAIEGWAKAHGVKIGQIHEDLDRSGGTMDRPGMNLALKRIEQGASGGIIVAKLDRFARTVTGGLQTIHDLHAKGARVVSVAESIDPATPIGRAMLGLLLIMAEWQRDQADEALSAAMTRANAAGRFVIKTPFGYRRSEEGRIKVDPVTAEVVRRIFRERAAGVGWRKIATDLTSEGIPTPRGGSQWGHSTVSGIVQSLSPLGHFKGPRGHELEGAWEPIVTAELWAQANAVRGVRDNDRRHHDRLLAGIARCAECRSTLKRTVNPEGYVSYACLHIGCSRRGSIGAHLLDQRVAGIVETRLAELALERTATEDVEGAALARARETATRELELWRDDLEMRTVLGESDYRQGLMERAKARDATEAALSEHRSRARLDVVHDAPNASGLSLSALEWDDRRRVVEAYLHSVWVRPSTVRGPGARRHVAQRVRVVWMDDRDRPALPSPSGRPQAPVPWPYAESTRSPDSDE